MYCISSDTTNPYFNLAVEEQLLKNRTEEYFILCINNLSVVAGKHQCVHREINIKYIEENHIPVIRRITGGGTVYHDEGNLNYCFIRNCETGKQVDFPRYTRPITGFLGTLGLNAVQQGSDITVDGLKFSGNAEHVFRNRVLHHGTLLWNASLDTLRNCLRKDNSSFKTRAVASRPAHVANLSGRIQGINSISDFKSRLMDYILKTEPGAVFGNLPDYDIKEAENLSGKYKTWEWNYAYGPEYELSRDFTYKGIRVECTLKVKDGLIEKCTIEGNHNLSEIFRKVEGTRHMPDEMNAFLRREKLTDINVYLFF